MKDIMFLLFDIGGTNTRVGISKNGKKVDAVEIFPSDKDFRKEMELIGEKARELANGKKIKAAAGGIASALNKTKSKMLYYPNGRPGWKGKSIKKELEKVLHAKVFVENDCVMVGLGEMQKGAGKKKGIGAYLTVSSGVGGARFVNGAPDESSRGFEPGSQYIYFKGKSVMLENVVSGVALKKRYGKDPKDIKSNRVWEEEAKYVAVGLNNIIVQWSPDIVVLGGSVMKKVSLLQVKVELKRMLKIFPNLPLIKKAELGDIGGLHGALYYLNKLAK
jgi:predicted NBD/HSP70 family sugar kinase